MKRERHSKKGQMAGRIAAVLHLEKQGGLGDDTSDKVRVAVGSGTPVLKVTVALRRNVTGDTN